MKIFCLPDLGEGLPEAIIREWYVQPGDEVQIDQTIVAMETAKALVDVPSPFAGKIEKLFGKTGDTIMTGSPLIGVEGQETDAGTVVGNIEASDRILEECATGVSVTAQQANHRATPAVRMLAQQLGVDLDEVKYSGKNITADDVKKAANLFQSNTIPPLNVQFTDAVESLTPTRRAMVMSMTQSHQHIVPVSISDDADIHDWIGKQDTTVRLLRAIQAGCETVPIANA
jgi:2-oxoisovalerate dehydrogenase E2 component (dihydrolipoyl transacylase)